MQLDKDAFSSGQILSKIWLAEELEKAVIGFDQPLPLRILALGGWYGLINFILRSRNNLPIEIFRNVDVDCESCKIADSINESWVWREWEFKSLNYDANLYSYDDNEYNVVINTSTEHMFSKDWFLNIPRGMLTVLQSNNMPHSDHHNTHQDLGSFIEDFNLSKILFSDEKLFKYPDWEFKRFMVIGIK